jgi:peptide/nickel transport system permease protein
MLRRFLRMLLSISLTVMAAGLLSATLVRFAPGFGIDERELDPRLNVDSVREIRQSRGEGQSVILFYTRYLRNLVHGDLGKSAAFGRPVGELLRDRIPASAMAVGSGLACGWMFGLGLASMAVLWAPALDIAGSGLTALCLSAPAPVLALLFVFAGHNTGTDTAHIAFPVAAVVALVVFPRVFRYVRGILAQVSGMPHVLAAHTRGLGRLRILLTHVLTPSAPSILALAGVSVSVAFGAAIPIEVICDYPGIGQLAWKAALERDLPLLIDITLLVTIMATVSNSVAEMAGAWLSPRGASA